MSMLWADEVLPADANYDEAKVGQFTLPDPLVGSDGQPVTTAEQWRTKRRPELLNLFRTQMYGQSPAAPPKGEIAFDVQESAALDGRAVRKDLTITMGTGEQQATIKAVIYLPAAAQGPVPLFVGLHLFPTKDPYPVACKPLVKPDDASSAEGWDDPLLADLPGDKVIEAILARGYGIASLNAADIAPDDAKTWREGIVGWAEKTGAMAPGDESWGAIGAWAWALGRVLDYCQTDPAIDAKRVIAIGHSRMGKTALWAAAQDQRFAAAISNNSGCGGAALSRRNYGETVKHINDRFPHWFCGNFKQYNDRENEIPFDQHELIALIAPRPAYVASALEDRWADPRGEFLAAVGADPVYRLLGQHGLGIDKLPKLNQPVGDQLGFHLRVGGHALSDFDWLRYLDFADRTVK